mgnify:CR=1 FL=1
MQQLVLGLQTSSDKLLKVVMRYADLHLRLAKHR